MTRGLIDWATRALCVAEDGSRAHVIRLSSEGQTWESWPTDGLSAEEFVKQADAVLEGLTSEFPPRKFSVMFVAEEKTGAVLAQFPKTMMGTNKGAAEVGANAAAKSLADAMASCASTMDAILKSAKLQVETMSMQLEKQATQIHDLVELCKAQREAEIVGQEQQNKVGSFMLEQVQQLAPLGFQALELVLAKSKQKTLADAASAAVSAATKTHTNGAAS